MAIPTRTAVPGTYFITAATHARRRLFQVPANADLFLATLQHYRREATTNSTPSSSCPTTSTSSSPPPTP